MAGRPRSTPDPIIDAEIALYRACGWKWVAIATYFGMSYRTAKRRYERLMEQRRKEARA